MFPGMAFASRASGVQKGVAMAPQPISHPDVALNLALAIVASSTAPLLLLKGDLTLVGASKSFCRAFGIDPAGVPDKALRELGTGEWNVPQLNVLLKATASGQAEVENYEIDLRRAGKSDRRLVLNAQKLAYGNEDSVLLLISVLDVTDARIAEKLKDDLLRDKAVLLQELQHRVANSLQIIASVLMQSAKKVQSEESRIHLVDAHQRVMSVASLQKQLAASRLGDVELRPYFAALCESIGSSMIHDREKVSLSVNTDNSITTADTSICLGLIITELVINALKHAFPDDRTGMIRVDYRTRGADWTLSVGDDGVGFSSHPDDTKPGLGTSIVQALAKQLDADVDVTSENSGTKVSIAHIHTPALAAQGASQANRAV
jgi:two-component sensor histidine kinase